MTKEERLGYLIEALRKGNADKVDNLTPTDGKELKELLIHAVEEFTKGPDPSIARAVDFLMDVMFNAHLDLDVHQVKHPK